MMKYSAMKAKHLPTPMNKLKESSFEDGSIAEESLLNTPENFSNFGLNPEKSSSRKQKITVMSRFRKA